MHPIRVIPLLAITLLLMAAMPVQSETLAVVVNIYDTDDLATAPLVPVDGVYELHVGETYKIVATGPNMPYDDIRLDVEDGPVFTHWLSDTAGAEWSTLCTLTCPLGSQADMTQYQFTGVSQVPWLIYRNTVASSGPITMTAHFVRGGAVGVQVAAIRAIHRVMLPLVLVH